ncbi:hypothetical protein VTJ04DRAFT_182 [Mycothermus thermophilus]|uniref:uncharacterized protein n=1 Tax=Humicola insolens TaxID=85995 RepID=UPI003743954D
MSSAQGSDPLDRQEWYSNTLNPQTQIISLLFATHRPNPNGHPISWRVDQTICGQFRKPSSSVGCLLTIRSCVRSVPR